MMANAKNLCDELGLYVYKSNMFALLVRHLDGRHTMGANNIEKKKERWRK
jgi:hypothetical protein